MINPYISWFEFDGKNSHEYGLVISEKSTFNVAGRRYETLEIAGKDGEVIKDNGTFSNVKISYTVGYLKQNPLIGSIVTQTAIDRIKVWLSKPNYCRLIDSADPEYFRLAVCNDEIDFNQSERGIITATIDFNCKPFKYALSGEKIITLTEPEAIVNTSNLTALPYIKIYGTDTIDLYIGSQHFLLKNVENEIEIDSEKMIIYKISNGTVVNQTSKYYSADFPKLISGENHISWSGTVSKIELKPRWCKL